MSPLVSVITVCKDAREDFIRTRDSLYSQNFRDFEWIIVDGQSTDGTSEILHELKVPWIQVISEPDKGIYDAMNKGLRLARGKWIWFMNAGDRFFADDSLGSLDKIPSSIDICFGDVIVEGDDGTPLGKRSVVSPHKLPELLSRDAFRKGMVVSHQAFVARRSIVPEYQEDRYRLSADLDWMLRILDTPRQSVNLGILAKVTRRGATMDNWYTSQYERFKILARHFGFFQTAINHVLIGGRRVRHGMKTKLWK